MKTILRFVPAAGALLLVFASCGQLQPSRQQIDAAVRGLGPVPKATGGLDIQWLGGKGKEVAPGEEKLAAVDFAWFEGRGETPAKGYFHYVVHNSDGTLHREITAEVTDDAKTGVLVDEATATAYFVGVVTSDSKKTASGEGAMGSGAEDEGGCGEATDEGTCTGGGENETGCSGDGTEPDKQDPPHPPGSGTRLGEYIAAKVQDVATPGAGQDTISWNWFYANPDPKEHPNALEPPAIDPQTSWPALCTKTILGGNLVVHTSE